MIIKLTTAWDDYFNRRRPYQRERLLTSEQAWNLSPGTHIMVMFGGCSGPIEFEIIDDWGIRQLVNVYSKERQNADDVFNNLGEGTPFNVAWVI